MRLPNPSGVVDRESWTEVLCGLGPDFLVPDWVHYTQSWVPHSLSVNIRSLWYSNPVTGPLIQLTVPWHSLVRVLGCRCTPREPQSPSSGCTHRGYPACLVFLFPSTTGPRGQSSLFSSSFSFFTTQGRYTINGLILTSNRVKRRNTRKQNKIKKFFVLERQSGSDFNHRTRIEWYWGLRTRVH